MEEKELTDEEIVKALDICFAFKGCTNECPYFNKNGRNFCVEDKALYKDLKRIVLEHAEQKAEIERLTEDVKLANDLYLERTKVLEDFRKKNVELQSNIKQLEKDFAIQRDKKVEYYNKCVELQKQVDELKNRFENKACCNMSENCSMIQKAVKDTSKEIFKDIFESLVFGHPAPNEEYRNGYEQALYDYDEKLRKFAKECYGVEVK